MTQSTAPAGLGAGTWKMQFPGNLAWSNAALMTKGMAPYGAVAMGEIDEVCVRLAARQTEPDAWREEWCAMGERLQARADAAQQAGLLRRHPNIEKVEVAFGDTSLPALFMKAEAGVAGRRAPTVVCSTAWTTARR